MQRASNIDVTRYPAYYVALLLTGYMRRSKQRAEDPKKRLKSDDEVDIVVMEKVHQIDITV